MSKILEKYEITDEVIFKATVDEIIKLGDFDTGQIHDEVIDYMLVDRVEPAEFKDACDELIVVIEMYKKEISKLTNFIFDMIEYHKEFAWIIISPKKER